MHAAQMKVRNALGAAVMSALAAWAPGQAQAADRFVSTAGSDAATATTIHVVPPNEIRYAGTSSVWSRGSGIP